MKNFKSCALRGRSDSNWTKTKYRQNLEIGSDISNSLTSVQKDSYVLEINDDMITSKETREIKLPDELKEKSFRVRKLTPRECFRLMGVNDDDIDKIQSAPISNSSQYKLAGNSIVVDVLFYLFESLLIDDKKEMTEQSS